MQTNFQMLRKLNKDFTPKQFGVISGSEVEQIKSALCIEEMDALQLRNLRDFTVMFFSRSETLEDSDKCSAIVSVIDQRLFNLGEEV